MIQEKKRKSLEKEMKRLNISEKDLIETFVLGSAKGGQKAQKTHNAVDLLHVTTNIRVQCQEERDREVNRYKARIKLCERVQKLQGEQTKKEKLQDKKKKQKTVKKISKDIPIIQISSVTGENLNEAIQSMDGNSIVFLHYGNMFQAVPVKLGIKDDNFTEIKHGLEIGQVYVSKNSFLIKADLEKSGASHAH